MKPIYTYETERIHKLRGKLDYPYAHVYDVTVKRNDGAKLEISIFVSINNDCCTIGERPDVYRKGFIDHALLSIRGRINVGKG